MTCKEGDLNQKMLNDIHNFETKTGLNKLEGSYFQVGECSNIFQIPVITNSGENMSSVIRQKCESSNEGNKET